MTSFDNNNYFWPLTKNHRKQVLLPLRFKQEEFYLVSKRPDLLITKLLLAKNLNDIASLATGLFCVYYKKFRIFGFDDVSYVYEKGQFHVKSCNLWKKKASSYKKSWCQSVNWICLWKLNCRAPWIEE